VEYITCAGRVVSLTAHGAVELLIVVGKVVVVGAGLVKIAARSPTSQRRGLVSGIVSNQHSKCNFRTNSCMFAVIPYRSKARTFATEPCNRGVEVFK